MKKRALSLLLALSVLLVIFTGCSQKGTEFDRNASFDDIVKLAKGQTVTFYGWGGNSELNGWIDSEVAPLVKEKYDITLKRVPMDIDQILNKLSGEKQANKASGSIDMIWINGENFYSAKENGLLYGPFTEYLPNYKTYLDEKTEDNIFDFGYPIEGYEVPYGKAQMVFINNHAIAPEMPKNTHELLEFAKKYKGKVTYAAPPDFTGSAFVRNIIYDIVGYEQLIGIKIDKETIKQAIAPAVAYLNEIKPYLWNGGKTYPSTMAQLDNMYADGEVVMTMSYEPYLVAKNIEMGVFPDSSTSFIFDKGTIGNTNFIAIANNSPNKQSAMLVINEILSPKLQASKYDMVNLLPVLDNSKLSKEEQALFDAVDLGKSVIAQDVLLSKRLPELPAKLVPIIEEIWQEEVAAK